MLSGSSHLLTVADLVLQDGVVRLSWDRPVQSQAALGGVTLPNHRHQRWHCTDGRRILNTAGYSDHSCLSTSSSRLLTVMGSGDVDTFAGRFLAAELRHPVERLDCKDVRGVRQQAPHLQPALQQAVLRGPVAHTVSAGQARPLGRPARRAPDGVAQVCSAAAVQRLVPLQTERAIVHPGDDAAWS